MVSHYLGDAWCDTQASCHPIVELCPVAHIGRLLHMVQTNSCIPGDRKTSSCSSSGSGEKSYILTEVEPFHQG